MNNDAEIGVSQITRDDKLISIWFVGWSLSILDLLKRNADVMYLFFIQVIWMLEDKFEFRALFHLNNAIW